MCSCFYNCKKVVINLKELICDKFRQGEAVKWKILHIGGKKDDCVNYSKEKISLAYKLVNEKSSAEDIKALNDLWL